MPEWAQMIVAVLFSVTMAAAAIGIVAGVLHYIQVFIY